MLTMLNKKFVQFHKLNISIFIFLILFTTLHLAKPGFAYGPDGEFRNFGIGFKNKTVLPIWVMAIVIAVLSYLSVMWYCR